MRIIILSFASFVIGLLTVALIKQRFSQQLLDIPNERSSHTQPTPRGGGLGFIIAFAITSTIPLTRIASLHATAIGTPSSIYLPLWLVLIPAWFKIG